MSEQNRKALAEGNEYLTGPSESRRFKISELWFKGPNPGVAVAWLTVSGLGVTGGQFFLCADEAGFWDIQQFRTAIDVEGE